MPIKACSKDGQDGHKWGATGKCYTGDDSREKAGNQAQAAYASGYKKNENLLKEVEELLMEQPGQIDPRLIAYLRDLIGLVKNNQNELREIQKGPQGLEVLWETFSHFEKRLRQLETGKKEFPDLQSKFPDAPGYWDPGTVDGGIEETLNNSSEEDILEYKSKIDSYGNLVFELKSDE